MSGTVFVKAQGRTYTLPRGRRDPTGSSQAVGQTFRED